MLELMTAMKGSLAQKKRRGWSDLYEAAATKHEAQSKAMRRQVKVPSEQARLGSLAISERDAGQRSYARSANAQPVGVNRLLTNGSRAGES